VTETDSDRGGIAWLPAGLGPALAMIGLCAAALAAVELAVVLPGDEGVSDAVAALPVITSLTYVAAGLIAWARRPHNRMGPLLCAGGLAWIG
jgi:hypothetical protein